MVTIRDVAQEAGVSPATVSYALRGDPRIRPETAEQVLKAARKLHYTVNLTAKNLRTGRTGIIGLALYELNLPYTASLVSAITNEADRRGLQVLAQQTGYTREGESAVFRNVTNQFCDGTIFAASHLSNDDLLTLSQGKPIVLLDDRTPPSERAFDTVLSVGAEGVREATELLMRQGARRIAVLGADRMSPEQARGLHTVTARRLTGFFEALASGSSSPTDETAEAAGFLPCTWSSEAARTTIIDAVRGGARFDALLCMTDLVSMGAVRGLTDCGLSVPDDVKVIGVDGIHETAYTVPSLSTVAVDFQDLARKALDLITSRIDAIASGEADDPGLPPRTLTADFTVIERESTGGQG
ncbi:LacI family transcriptional regulator [Bifidobacterium vespertilionis]|uniref:LacI family transcriptional regulator n=2 Tax=Bifidobacterium vespertilionis TaxID=2562524 RepID=A0A5J5DV52_9BIFI|nr:LacI family DNA-binding transcriptional regulator [Bifidobacterium vespertilionis]KAA8820211.1 LacI family transcriptional regulator [Bifidobacterium vespertilionis]KAA8823864.1 LacI family transcriptional regulator [Bifidobacterium vespertilionis]